MSSVPPQSAPKTSFAPIVGPGTRLLVLGSLPGEASLAAGRYYAHPRNQFWRLMEHVLEQPIASLPYEARIEALSARGVGLWDTVGSARRRGSLDTALREIAPNLLRELLHNLPALRAVAFNGGTAARIGGRALADAAVALIDLPSSSPALTLAFATKAERWAVLREFLGPGD